MTITSRTVLAFRSRAVCASPSVTAGCSGADSSSSADAFREALLAIESDVALGVPGAQATNVGTKNIGIHLQDTPATGTATGAGADSSAQYYTFTRDITGAVDFTTAVILGGIWAIVHSDPDRASTPTKRCGVLGSSNCARADDLALQRDRGRRRRIRLRPRRPAQVGRPVAARAERSRLRRVAPRASPRMVSGEQRQL